MKSWKFLTLTLLAAWTSVPSVGIAAEPVNRYAAFSLVKNVVEGISWPSGQALPVFATPARGLDAIEVQSLSPDEQLTFSALQGQVNRKQPRILVLDTQANEGRDTWTGTPSVGFDMGKVYDRDNKFELLAKYAAELEGVVLYDTARSSHYRNLAGTVAGLKRALPVTAEVNALLKGKGVELKVLEDLSALPFINPVEIYDYLYKTCWPDCTKRLIVSAKPLSRGDLHHTRDIAAATRAAVVWLDSRFPEEKKLMRRFFGDMKAGDAIVLGWYPTERSGITTASEFGIGTLPADYYVSPSVFSGTDHRILIPGVPKMPALDNKVYVSLFISDGDNIQYNQHAMREVWDRTAAIRGGMPLNWTIAPGLVDIGPGILNYYYTHATPDDCFVTGPSGMGYMMPFNTLDEPGAPVGLYTADESRIDGYTRLTETYLQRSGLRVTTIWDDATPMQREAYERNCRHLYGLTVQNFKDVPSVRGGVTGDRLRFDKLVIPYAGSYEHISSSMKRQIASWDGKSPRFISYQANIWGELKPHRLIELRDNLEKEFPGKVQFVRADHYFNLHNQADGLPFNLVLAVTSTLKSANSADNPAAITDGTPVTVWTTPKQDHSILEFDFGSQHTLSRCVIRHAGDSSLSAEFNTRSFTLKTSTDGKSWETAATIRDNTANVTDIDLPPVTARFLNLSVENSGADGTVRIADFEVFGSQEK